MRDVGGGCEAVLTARSLWAQPCESGCRKPGLLMGRFQAESHPCLWHINLYRSFCGLQFVSIGTKNKDMLAPQELAETANQGRKKKASRGVQLVINAARVDWKEPFGNREVLS